MHVHLICWQCMVNVRRVSEQKWHWPERTWLHKQGQTNDEPCPCITRALSLNVRNCTPTHTATNFKLSSRADNSVKHVALRRQIVSCTSTLYVDDSHQVQFESHRKCRGSEDHTCLIQTDQGRLTIKRPSVLHFVCRGRG